MATTHTTTSNLTVKIVPNDKGNPPGKLGDAELHFSDGVLAGPAFEAGRFGPVALERLRRAERTLDYDDPWRLGRRSPPRHRRCRFPPVGELSRVGYSRVGMRRPSRCRRGNGRHIRCECCARSAG